MVFIVLAKAAAQQQQVPYQQVQAVYTIIIMAAPAPPAAQPHQRLHQRLNQRLHQPQEADPLAEVPHR
jgi:hypothetical protein